MQSGEQGGSWPGSWAHLLSQVTQTSAAGLQLLIRDPLVQDLGRPRAHAPHMRMLQASELFPAAVQNRGGSVDAVALQQTLRVTSLIYDSFFAFDYMINW